MHTPVLDDTIVAVSSGWRASPLGIVRLSGPAAFELLECVRVALPPADPGTVVPEAVKPELAEPGCCPQAM